MRKKVFGKHLSRDTDTRKALFRSLVRSLILHDSVTTTKTKAKAVQGSVDTLVRLAQDKSIFSQRKMYARLANDRAAATSLLTRVSGFSARTSGFTRLINLPARKGDQAAMVRMEWVEKGTLPVEKKASKKDTKASKTEKKSVVSKVLSGVSKKKPAKETEKKDTKQV